MNSQFKIDFCIFELDVDEPITIEINPNYFNVGSDSDPDSNSDSEIVFKVQLTTRNEE